MPEFVAKRLRRGRDRSGHIQNGKPARHKNPRANWKENGKWPQAREMAEEWPQIWKMDPKNWISGVHFSILAAVFRPFFVPGAIFHFPFSQDFVVLGQLPLRSQNAEVSEVQRVR